jgi:hypothetical protein
VERNVLLKFTLPIVRPALEAHRPGQFATITTCDSYTRGKMRHVALGHMYIQELVQIKQVIIGKIDGKQNPANTLTKHLATASDMLGSLDGLGVIDLTDKGFPEHVRKTKLRVVSSVNFKKWKPLMALKTTLREHNGAILRRHKALPTHWRETPHHE